MKSLYLFITIVLLASCRQNASVVNPPNDNDTIFYILSRMPGFSLPLGKNFPDKSTLLFGCEESFDTSFIIHLSKDTNKIHGVAYEVVPQHRGSITGFAWGDDEILPFEGYGFNLDSTHWNSLLVQTELLFKEKALQGKNGHRCTDGTDYFLAYNGKLAIGGNCTDSSFEKFTQYLKDSLLAPIHAKRRGWY